MTASTLGCGAKSSAIDAGERADARSRPDRPDAQPFVIPDATPTIDASTVCVDSNETNNTLMTATSLSATPIESGDAAGGSFSGSVMGADEDWFTYQGVDVALGIVDPAVSVTAGGENIELCMFFSCATGTAGYECQGTTASTSGEVTGCCSSEGFRMDSLLDCPPDDNATVFIRVKSSGAANSCETYSISYHY